MSKSKFTFKLGNRGRQTPAEISWVQSKVQEFSLILGGISYFSEHEKFTAGIALGGFIINTILQCVGYRDECTVEIKEEKKESL